MQSIIVYEEFILLANVCLHTGAFGRVFKGLLQTENITSDGKRIILPVAIKTVKS